MDEAQVITELNRRVSRFKRRVIRRIKRRHEREVYYAEQESKLETLDPKMREPGESWIAWWTRTGASQHNRKTWH